MVSASSALYYAFHPNELRSIIQWKLYHDPVHQRDKEKESESVSKCYYLLDLSSRSFSSVIQELHPELKLPVALFYCILRGLDTIEDDMTLALEKKDPLLRNFHLHIEEEGWNFDGSGPDEKDREVLVQFDNVVKEFRAIKVEYRKIIADTTKKMGNGMADFANNAEFNVNGVDSIKDYNLYCHYVAGVVGEGLTRLFVESKLGNPLLLDRPHLHESMGLMLQKVNIIRDIREDFDDRRRFWPKEIWSKHVENFEDLFKPENREAALRCSSDMILDALQHAEDCLFYLAGLKEQSVFNFCAIPQTMAMATLELCFQNGNMFERNVKITKGQACQLMTESSQNLRVVSGVFRGYAHKILKKNNPRDPNFLKLSMTCSNLEKFIQGLFPSPDPKIAAEVGIPTAETEETRSDAANLAELTARQTAEQEEAKWDLIYMALAVTCTLMFISAIMIGVAWYFGARFDLPSTQYRKNLGPRPSPGEAQNMPDKLTHGDL